MSAFPRPIAAVIFDLDGVLTDTANLHYRAWKRLADSIGAPFDAAANERLKGVDRMTSLELILGPAAKTVSAAEKARLAAIKDGWYRESIAEITPADLFPGARAALEAVRSASLRTALASASRNAGALLERLGITGLFDHVVDAGRIVQGKPAPDIYLRAAEAVGAPPGACLGVEDAAAGVEAILAAGMAALGVGSPDVLARADAVIGAIADFRLSDYAEARA